MYNLIQLFLVLRCSGACPYCIQGDIKRGGYNEVEPDAWISFIKSQSKGLKIGLIGGEPTLYKGLSDIIEATHQDYFLTVTTNLKSPMFSNFDSFIEWARRYRCRWNLSFHPSVVPLDYFISAVMRMRLAGLWVDQVAAVYCDETKQYIKQLCDANIGFWFQTSTYTDEEGVLHPTEEELNMYGSGEAGIDDIDRYNYLCGGKKDIKCVCYTNKLLVDPEGDAYRCHRDIYSRECSIGNALSGSVRQSFVCENLGECNPCDYSGIKYWEL